MVRKFVKLCRPKPTLKEALQYLEKGHYGVDQSAYVSPEDRIRKLQAFEAETEKLLRSHIPRGHNLTLVMLKCHIILEFMLNKFIELVAHCEVDISKERFSFAQKITLLHLLGFPPNPTTIPSLEILNGLRNQVAHALELDHQKVDLLIRINSDDPDEVGALDDEGRAKWIKTITAFIAGVILGCVMAHNVDAWEETTARNR